MSLSKNLKRYLTSELRTAAEMIEKHDNPQDKVYYLSAPFGAVNRVFNIEYSSDLVLLWVILRTTHGSISSRLDAMKAGGQQPLHVPEGAFEALTALLVQLAEKIEREEDYIELLKGLSAVAYSCDGNGFYLHSTGRLRYE